jgi:hypothetical protein
MALSAETETIFVCGTTLRPWSGPVVITASINQEVFVSALHLANGTVKWAKFIGGIARSTFF